MNIDKPIRYHKLKDLVQPVYDKVVDRSDFKRGQDKERAMRLQGDTGGSTTQGVYDFEDENIDESKMPSDIQLALRNGKLDKADVDTLMRVQKESAKKEHDEKVSEREKKQREEIAEARQSFLDDRVGFDKNSAKSDK